MRAAWLRLIPFSAAPDPLGERAPRAQAQSQKNAWRALRAWWWTGWVQHVQSSVLELQSARLARRPEQ